jgi:hypothetical protein
MKTLHLNEMHINLAVRSRLHDIHLKMTKSKSVMKRRLNSSTGVRYLFSYALAAMLLSTKFARESTCQLVISVYFSFKLSISKTKVSIICNVIFTDISAIAICNSNNLIATSLQSMVLTINKDVTFKSNAE